MPTPPQFRAIGEEELSVLTAALAEGVTDQEIRLEAWWRVANCRIFARGVWANPRLALVRGYTLLAYLKLPAESTVTGILGFVDSIMTVEERAWVALQKAP